MTTRVHLAALIAVLASLPACGEPGNDPYAGWDTFDGPSAAFSVRYLSPPWTMCSGTEYEPDCHECPTRLLSSGLCGGGSSFSILWVPPALLDPDFLLIPPYKLEISWFAGTFDPLTLAQAEQTIMAGQGLEITVPARAITLADGTVAAEVGYGGPMYIYVGSDPINRPDERDFRVVYVAEAGLGYRLALDTAIDITSPEVRDMLASFTTPAAGGAP